MGRLCYDGCKNTGHKCVDWICMANDSVQGKFVVKI